MAYEGRPLLCYRFGASPFKPYVRELYSPEGVNVLADGPKDHLHHHGLMYGVIVNDVNYWEETSESGFQRTGPEVSRTVLRDEAGRPKVQISHRVYWVPAGVVTGVAESAVLVEERTLSLSVDDASGEVALEWLSDFEVGAGVTRVQLTGAGYHGLGLRMNPAFDGSAKRRNSAGSAYAAAGTWDVKAATWESFSQVLQGRPVSVTLFGDSANVGERRFFSMLNGFAYLSATQGLEQKPLEYGAGARFRLRYLLTVQRGEPSEAWLNQRRERWLATGGQRLSR